MQKRIKLVLNLLHDAQIEVDCCSCNFVADFAFNRGIELYSYEIIIISDSYGTDKDISGRS